MTKENATYAVIFTSTLKQDSKGYPEMATHLEQVAKEADGFLGIESARGEDGFGISVSYWKDLASIEKWKNNTEHVHAKKKGMKDWYEHYSVKITKIASQY